MISFSKPGRLLFYGARSLLLTDRNGRVIAQGQWPRARLDLLDSGAAVSGDGQHLAYRLSDARPGAHRGMAVLYLLHPGDKSATAIYRHRLGPVACGVGASMRWNGRQLLYSSADGQVALINANSGRRRDLSQLAAALPRHTKTEQASISWSADYQSAPPPRGA